MKKLALIFFIFFFSFSFSTSKTTNKKDTYVGWYFYNGKDPEDIELHGENLGEVFYIGEDYAITYRSPFIKEKDKSNLKICKEIRKFDDFFRRENLVTKYTRKLTNQEENNVKINLKTAKQSKQLCEVS